MLGSGDQCGRTDYFSVSSVLVSIIDHWLLNAKQKFNQNAIAKCPLSLPVRASERSVSEAENGAERAENGINTVT